MPKTSTDKKALRSSKKKRVFNIARKKEMKASVKELEKAITEKDQPGAQAAFPRAQKAIDKAAKRGIIKQNTASRKKSRLVKKIKSIK